MAVPTNFIIGATFDASKAVSQLNKFIAQVNAKAAEASASIVSSLSGGAKAGGQFIPVDAIKKDIKNVEKATGQSARTTAKDAEKAVAASASALSGSTKDVKAYGAAISRATLRWGNMRDAMKAYAVQHDITLKAMTTQIHAYSAAIKKVAAETGVTSQNLVGSLAGLAKSARNAEKAVLDQKATLDKPSKGLSEEQKNMARINAAAETGVGVLNRRIHAMQEELSASKQVLSQQKENISRARQAAVLQDQRVKALRAEQKASKGALQNEAQITHASEMRSRAIGRVVEQSREYRTTQSHIAKLNNDIARSTGGIAKQTLIAASNLTTVIKRVALWSTGIGIIFGIVNRINKAFTDTVELQNKLTQIAKIKPIGYNVEPLRQTALDTAIKYGIAVGDIAETMRVFAQQGKNNEEIMKLIDIAAKGVVATNLTMNNSVQLLTATMNIFKVSLEGVEVVLDKIQNVQANYAVTAEDLSDAMRLLGPIIKALGADMDFLLGSVTAVSEATRQTGKFVGNALKTIFARLPKKDSIFLMNSLGVSLFNMRGQLLPLNQVLGELAGKWDTLTDQAKLNLAVTLGGIRRYNVFITLMENWDRVVSASATSMHSFGAAQEAVNKEAESWSRRLAIVGQKLTAVGIVVAETITPALVNLAELLTFGVNKWTIYAVGIIGAVAAINKLGKSAQNIAIVQAVLEAANIRVGLFSVTMKEAIGSALGLTGAITAKTVALGIMNKMLTGSVALLKGFGVSLLSLGVAIAPYAIVIGGLVLAFKALYDAKKRDQALNDEIQKSIDSFNRLNLDFDAIDALPASAVKASKNVEELRVKLNALGVQGQSSADLVNNLNVALRSYITGFSTKETIKELENAEEAVKSLTSDFDDLFDALGSDLEKGLDLEDIFKGSKAAGSAFKRIETAFQNVDLDFETVLRKNIDEADIEGQSSKFWNSFISGFGFARRTGEFPIFRLSELIDAEGAEIARTEEATKAFTKTIDDYVDAKAKQIVIEERAGSVLNEVIGVNLRTTNAYQKLIDSIVAQGNVQGLTNSRFVKSIKVFNEARVKLLTFTDEQKKSVLAGESMDETLAAMNDEYIDLLNSLDDVNYKFRVQQRVTELVGSGYDVASASLTRYRDLVSEYVSRLEKVRDLESKYAREQGYALRQAAISEDTENLVSSTEELGKVHAEVFQSMSQENAKLVSQSIDTKRAYEQLLQIWGRMTGGLGELQSQIVDLVDNLKKSGDESKNFTDAFTDFFSSINKWDAQLANIRKTGHTLSKPFDVLAKTLTQVQSQIQSGNIALARAGATARQNASDIDVWTASMNDLDGQIIELSLNTTNLNFASQGGVAPAQEIARLTERRQALHEKILNAETLHGLASREHLETQNELNRLEERYRELVKDTVAYRKDELANSIKLAETQSAALGIELRIQSSRDRLSNANVARIKLTNDLYDARIASIKRAGIEEAKFIKQQIDAGNTEVNAELYASELATKKALKIVELELARIADLRKQKEEAMTKIYELQSEKLTNVSEILRTEYSRLGDLLVRPIDEALSLAGSLGFKIAANTRKYQIQEQVLDSRIESMENLLAGLDSEDTFTKDIVESQLKQLKAQTAIEKAQIGLNKSMEQANIAVTDYLESISSVPATYQAIRQEITKTAGDFDALLEDAHVFTNLFDNIGRIFFSKSIESLFDKMFEVGDDSMAKMLETGALNVVVKFFPEADGMDKLVQAIQSKFTGQQEDLRAYSDTLKGTITALYNGLTQALTVIGDNYVAQIRKILTAAEGRDPDTEAQTREIQQLQAELDRYKGMVSDYQAKAINDLQENRLNVAGTAAFKAMEDMGNLGANAMGDITDYTKETPTVDLQSLVENVLRVYLVGIDSATAATLASQISTGMAGESLKVEEQGDGGASKDSGTLDPKTVQKFNAAISLLSIGIGAAVGPNAGRGISSGAGLGSMVSSLLGITGGGALGIAALGAVAGGIFGFQRDRQEERRKEDAERKAEEERRRREIEAARNRAAILDAAERVVQNTDPMRASTLFAPTGFRIPSYALRGGSLAGGQTNNFEITVPLGAEATSVAAEISRHVDGNYTDESARQSSNSDSYL